ncbi:MAG TPA: hypothetical protein PL151_07975 [Phycisphaerae bacterium]|nr:hypothetical protein [Phycisphaerae bacterium]HOJ74489.1 hypothetical protein [Phycisphaerae bacterium]HOM53314.1 hypothetical protein [Phycisphaerae bacterium]HON68134.1 hypothetical protein [Phycisphaerae bacterium]HOQ87507.1 hypothetical protein [Phycisphaerae bacterium]
MVVSIVAWIWAAVAFKHSCGGSPEWRRALLSCHLYGLVVVVPTTIGLAFGEVMMLRWIERGKDDEPFIVFLSIVGTLLAGAFVLGRRARQRIKDTIYPLQRQTAVRVARQTLASLVPPAGLGSKEGTR